MERGNGKKKGIRQDADEEEMERQRRHKERTLELLLCDFCIQTIEHIGYLFSRYPALVPTMRIFICNLFWWLEKANEENLKNVQCGKIHLGTNEYRRNL